LYQRGCFFGKIAQKFGLSVFTPENGFMNTINSNLLTRKEVAEKFNVVPETIRLWERRGLLPRIRINSRLLRYRQEDIDKLLQLAAPTSPATSIT